MDLSKCETLNPIYNKELRSLELHLEHGKANEMGSEQLFAWEQICEILEKGELIISNDNKIIWKNNHIASLWNMIMNTIT